MRKRFAARCVVDTNVAVTANGKQGNATRACVDASARALQRVMADGHLFVDDAGEIVREYRNNLNARGEPGPGDIFLKWVLTHEWGGIKVTRIPLTRSGDCVTTFAALPAPRAGTTYDPSDCKFLALAAAHGEHPPILQATDSKWWGWRDSLNDLGVKVIFLCPEIEQRYREKVGMT